MTINPLSVCNYLNLSRRDYAPYVASLIYRAELYQEEMPPFKFLLQAFRSMQFGEGIRTNSFNSYARLVIGMADALLTESFSGQTARENVNANLFGNVLYNMFNNTGKDITNTRLDANIPGEVIGLRSTMADFLLYRNYVAAFDRYVFGKHKVHYKELSYGDLDDAVDEFRRSINVDGYVKPFRYNNDIKALVGNFLDKVSTETLLRCEPMLKIKGQMSALLLFLEIDEDVSSPLEKARNAIAHKGGGDLTLPQLVKAMQSLVIVMLTHYIPTKKSFISNVGQWFNFYVCNPGVLLADTIMAVAAVVIPVFLVGSVILGFLLVCGDPELDKIHTNKMSDLERAVFYESVATRDTTTALHLHHRRTLAAPANGQK